MKKVVLTKDESRVLLYIAYHDPVFRRAYSITTDPDFGIPEGEALTDVVCSLMYDDMNTMHAREPRLVLPDPTRKDFRVTQDGADVAALYTQLVNMGIPDPLSLFERKMSDSRRYGIRPELR